MDMDGSNGRVAGGDRDLMQVRDDVSYRTKTSAPWSAHVCQRRGILLWYGWRRGGSQGESAPRSQGLDYMISNLRFRPIAKAGQGSLPFIT